MTEEVEVIDCSDNEIKEQMEEKKSILENPELVADVRQLLHNYPNLDYLMAENIMLLSEEQRLRVLEEADKIRTKEGRDVLKPRETIIKGAVSVEL